MTVVSLPLPPPPDDEPPKGNREPPWWFVVFVGPVVFAILYFLFRDFRP